MNSEQAIEVPREDTGGEFEEFRGNLPLSLYHLLSAMPTPSA